MGMVRCGMGEICGEGHGTSSAHMEFMSEKEMEAVDKELEEMRKEREEEEMLKRYTGASQYLWERLVQNPEEQLINEVCGPIDWPDEC